MKLSRHRVLGSPFSGLHALAAVLCCVLATNIVSAQGIKPDRQSAKSSAASRDPAETVADTTIAEKNVPDISGIWKSKSSGDDQEVSLFVTRAAGSRSEFDVRLEQTEKEKNAESFHLKWIPLTKRFEGSVPMAEVGVTGPVQMTLTLNSDGKKAIELLELTELQFEEFVNHVIETTYKKEDRSPAVRIVVKIAMRAQLPDQLRMVWERPVAISGDDVANTKAPDGITRDPATEPSDPATEPTMPDISGKRRMEKPSEKERPSAIPDSPAAKGLFTQLHAQESAAAAEAATIRQLQANGQAQRNKVENAEHQRKLKHLLGTAFDLKLQLEELQVKELQSRLSRLERQIGQRKELRGKIIARRTRELVDGDALNWNQASPEEVTEEFAARSVERPRTISNANQVAGIHWMGPNELVILMGGMEFKPNTVTAKFGIQRQSSELRKMDLFIKYLPVLHAALLVGRLEVFPTVPPSASFLQNNAIPIKITEEDIRAAWDQAVVKVIYLSNSMPDSPETNDPSARIETLDSTILDPEIDPIQEAQGRGTILAVLRLARNQELFEVPAAEKNESVGSRPGLPASQTPNNGLEEQGSRSYQPSYQEFAKKLGTMNSSVVEAEETLNIAERDAGNAIVVDTVPRARRRLEEAIRNRKTIQDEYAALLRDLELQVESAQTEHDAAQKNFHNYKNLKRDGVGSQKALDDALFRRNQSSTALERLKVRSDLYKKAGEGVAIGGDAAKPSLPSPEELKTQLVPIARRVIDCAETVRKLEVTYLRNRSNTAELKEALKELTQVRSEWRNRLKAIEPAFGLIEINYDTAKILGDSLGKKVEAITKRLEKGNATEADLIAATGAWKRAAESMVIAKSIQEKYEAVFDTIKDAQPDDHDDISYSRPVQSARHQSGHDPDVALAWLEAATGLKLEFVRFEDLQLWFKTALRVRESGGQCKAGDLIVALNNHLFDSLDQAVDALSAKEKGTNDDVTLSGGLGGHRRKEHFRGKHLSRYLRPGNPDKDTDGDESTISFEVLVRGEAPNELVTLYVQGICVSPDGLVAIPVAPRSLAPDEPLVAYGTIKGTARIVATDDAHGLTLVKLESLDQPLFTWLKCRLSRPATGQRLRLSDAYRQKHDEDVAEVGQPLPKPLKGHDAFVIALVKDLVIPRGTALLSVEKELQGITIESELSRDKRDVPDNQPLNRHIALPAAHIEKLVNEYRKSRQVAPAGGLDSGAGSP